MLDVSQDRRTTVAWSAAEQRKTLASAPGAIYWRRLLAELEPDEQVLLLDNLVDGMSTVYVAVSSRRVLMWATSRESAHVWQREHVQVVEHDTRGGLLRLSDGSGRRPVRVAGSSEQRRLLLRALKLAADASPLVPAALDLRSHRTTRWAYEQSPRPPAPTGPPADAIIEWLRRRTALAIVEVGHLTSRSGVEGAVAVLTAHELLLYMLQGRGAFLTLGLADLEVGRSDRGLWLSYDKAAGITSTTAGSSGSTLVAPAPVLYHLEKPLRDAVALVAQERERRATDKLARARADVDGGIPVPELPRTGIFRRRVRPVPIGSWREAEAVACSWLREMGYRDATVTPAGADAGVDIRGRKVVGQVKWQGTPTGRPTVQQLAGAAAHERKTGAFFSRAGYTRDAVGWAEKHGLALFSIDDTGAVRASTTPAKRLLAQVR